MESNLKIEDVNSNQYIMKTASKGNIKELNSDLKGDKNNKYLLNSDNK